MSTRPVVIDIRATPDFDFLYGRYKLSPWAIPYFSTTMSMRTAADRLSLSADFPGSDAVKWKLNELYQREIDWPRVERRIVPYLSLPDEPQFFNSLTIALLPMDRDLVGSPHPFSSDFPWSPPALHNEKLFAKILSVGPISCGFWNPWEDFSQAEAKTGQIRWNSDQVFAVALDGQHRLAAIQRFVDGGRYSSGAASDRIDETSIPVIFVVLDPAFGYVSPTNRPVVDVLRRIFIDLNKHAKIPSRARQILLDDKDPASVCVRALVGPALSNDLGELRAEPPLIPLSLVDWHTEQAKFDKGPYVTTILALDWAVIELTGAKPVQDLMDYNAFSRQLTALRSALDLDLSTAIARLREYKTSGSRPFSMLEAEDENEIARIARAFQRLWNPVFVKLLTEFAPYRDLIERRSSEGALMLDFSNWYRLWYQRQQDKFAGRATKDYDRFLGRLDARTPPVAESQLRQFLKQIEDYKDDNLAFNVVFQRAYFLAFNEFSKIKIEHLDEILSSGEVDVDVDFDVDFDDIDAADEKNGGGVDFDPASTEGVPETLVAADNFVCSMNALVDAVPNILRVDCDFETPGGDTRRFWLGTFLKAESGIDFTQGASVRGAELLFWAAAVQAFGGIADPNVRVNFDGFWNTVSHPAGGLAGRIRRSIDRFAKGAGKRILAVDGIYDLETEMAREEARIRLRWLWAQLGL